MSHGLWEICLEISGVGRLEFTLVEQTVRRFVRPDDFMIDSTVCWNETGIRICIHVYTHKPVT